MASISKILHERYQIICQLGQGGMGTVYEAEDIKRFNKRVALKEILADFSNSSDSVQPDLARRAFEREAKILTQVDHEAFPQVIDYFTEKERQYLVMELVKGEELGDLLKNHQTSFAIEDVLKWADQLLDALDYLHTLTPPIIHRDIKPQNIKLTSRGKIKLLDFGIAKGEESPLNTITNQTFIAATLNYSPIEQILRVLDVSVRAIIAYQHNEKIAKIEQQTADSSSDIYAFGATIYHLLTNQPPIDALKRSLEVWAGNPDPLINPQQLNPKIPNEISVWLLKAMAIESECRFNSATEMHQRLLQIVPKSRNLTNQNLTFNNSKDIYFEEPTINLETEILLNNQEIIEDFTKKNEGEAETFILPFLTQPSINEVTFEQNQDFPKKENSLLPTISNKLQKNNSQTSISKHQIPITTKKNNRIFLILSIITLVSFIFSGIIWKELTISKNKDYSSVENRNLNTNTNQISSTLPQNIENVSLVQNSPTPLIENKNVKKTKAKVTTLPVKNSASTNTNRRRQSDPNCIFNDNCR